MRKAYKLTAEERRARQEAHSLELLRSILDPTDPPPLWSAWRASWYLIGVHIDSSFLGHGNEPSLFAWLPLGAKQFHSDVGHRETEVSELRHDVAAFCRGESRRPAEWISHALSKDFRPDWVEVAIRDPKCRRLLPSKLLQKLGAKPTGEKRQAYAARVRHEDDPKSRAMAALKQLFIDWYESLGRDIPYGELTRWCEQKADEHEVDACSLRNATLRWRRDLR